MKKIFLLSAVTMISLLASAQIKKIEFQAAGLTCSMCSNAINKALKDLPFVAKIETDLNKNLFQVFIREGAQANPDQIVQKVEAAGFSVAGLWLIVDLPEMTVRNDEHRVLQGLDMHFMQLKTGTIAGTTRLQVIDRHYVSARDFKRYAHSTSMSCYQTGLLGSCCPADLAGTKGIQRIYHVTI